MTEKPHIVPISNAMEYLDAFNATKSRGGLPSNVMHDQTLVYSDFWQKIRNAFGSYYTAWSREIVAYPSKHGVFEKGDIKDSDYDWVLQSRYVPKAAIGKKNICLVIVPKDLQVVNSQVRIIPQSVYVQSFPQANGWYAFDQKTRIPTDRQPKSDADEAKRYLWRRDSQTLRPLARYVGVWDGYGRRYVYAYRWPDVRLGVGVVEPSEQASAEQKPEKKARKQRVTT